jgi:hypothetical protein
VNVSLLIFFVGERVGEFSFEMKWLRGATIATPEVVVGGGRIFAVPRSHTNPAHSLPHVCMCVCTQSAELHVHRTTHSETSSPIKILPFPNPHLSLQSKRRPLRSVHPGCPRSSRNTNSEI